MKRKPIASFLAAAALTAALAPAPAAAARFSDTVDHPAEAVIDRFATLRIVNGVGDGLYEPERTINRAEMCAILDRIFTYPQVGENTFPDMDGTEWYADNVLKASAAGVLLGDETGARPLDTIRWDEAVVMAGRAFRLEQDFSSPLPIQAADWAAGYIAAMWSAGFLDIEQLDPAAPFTRAEAVTLLDAIIAQLGWGAAGKILFQNRLYPIQAGVPVYSRDNANFTRGEDGRLYYDDGETPVAYGVDVSAYQKEIDWQAVAGDDIQFAILRVGGRGYGPAGKIYLDSWFEQNITGAREAGLDIGVYFFSQAITEEEAREEARVVLEQLGGRVLEYPVVFDWEHISGAAARTDGLDGRILDACALAFCQTIADAGYQPMVYFNASQAMRDYDLSVLTQYPFWYAYYTNGTVPWLYYDFRMWQHTSSGAVAGIEGRVDMNICFYPFTHHAPDVPQLPETTQEPELAETPDVPQAPEVPEEPEVLQAPEISEEPEVSQAPEISGEPEASQAPEASREA